MQYRPEIAISLLSKQAVKQHFVHWRPRNQARGGKLRANNANPNRCRPLRKRGQSGRARRGTPGHTGPIKKARGQFQPRQGVPVQNCGAGQCCFIRPLGAACGRGAPKTRALHARGCAGCPQGGLLFRLPHKGQAQKRRRHRAYPSDRALRGRRYCGNVRMPVASRLVVYVPAALVGCGQGGFLRCCKLRAQRA